MIDMETINWKVDGMTCGNCALSINKVLTKQGMQKVQVNAVTGEVLFDSPDALASLDIARKTLLTWVIGLLMIRKTIFQSKRNS